MPEQHSHPAEHHRLGGFFGFCIRRKPAVFMLVALVALFGVVCAPFDWDIPGLVRWPVAVDAIPDIGENQQIVFTEWSGRSPQDVEDQVTYPLTVTLLGVPGVRTVRSSSAFGFSTISVIFEDGVDFYFGRTRIVEKLASLSPDLLPEGVQPQLGPDATALGQVFWYTLEGQDPQGRPTGGWDPQELRTIQDFYVRYALTAAQGVSEVASVGGFVREYQVDVDPVLLQAYDVTLDQVVNAVRGANLDVGARTFEINRVEYLVRGLGFIKSVDDLRQAVVTTRDNVPIFLDQVAQVGLGPALRLGALDKNGTPAVGGVVTARYGENPMAVIKAIKARISEIAPGLPTKTLADGTLSQVRIVPFYDRAGLIGETLHTLDEALVAEVLVAVVVVLAMVMHLGSSLVIAALLPLAVLATFVLMKLSGVDANIVALAGIAIAIGTMVDMGIILTENIWSNLLVAPPGEPRSRTVLRASREVGGAVLTAIATTVIGFLPVFTMVGAEGKLFRPLAFTKTFALLASLMLALAVVPAAADLIFKPGRSRKATADQPDAPARPDAQPKPDTSRARFVLEACVYLGALLAIFVDLWVGLALAGMGLAHLAARRASARWEPTLRTLAVVLAGLAAAMVLARHWLPLGPGHSVGVNLIFTLVLLVPWIVLFRLFQKGYPRILRWCLDHKLLFMLLPATIVLWGLLTWLGATRLLAPLPQMISHSAPARALARAFPGLPSEFMPPLDEGAFLYMPSTMPHAAISEVLEIVAAQDKAISAIPEVQWAVGKLGRAETALDPAPVSMIETVITYHPEYLEDADGAWLRFAWDPDAVGLVRDAAGVPLAAPDGAGYLARGEYERDEGGRLVPDPDGVPFRLWRPALDPALNPGREPWPGVRGPEDIWRLVAAAAQMPGTTTAPRLQPISARLVMLQSGIRAPVAVEVKGPSLEAIEQATSRIEGALRQVAAIEPASVLAERIIAKPYLEIELDRGAVAMYGLDVRSVQEVIETAIGGQQVTTTVEGRERYPVRVRYMRELRGDFQDLESVLVTGAGGQQVPLAQLATFRYLPGPTMIKTEDAFLVGYVLFDPKAGTGAVQAVEQARTYLETLRRAGALDLPEAVSYRFTGTWENHERASRRLAFILPVTMVLIFLILYLHFARTTTALLVFSGVLVAWAGGFAMIWLFGQGWFFDVSLFGTSMRELFQMHPIALSLPVWVGFLALFGIASDDGVVMATYLEESFSLRAPRSVAEAREATVAAGLKRIRPCLMTTATTVLALLPVLTSRGRGSDLLVPMAIPPFGGMVFAVVTMLVVPVSFCWLAERKLARRGTAMATASAIPEDSTISEDTGPPEDSAE